MQNNKNGNASRRHFLGALATGAAAMGAATLAPVTTQAKNISNQFAIINADDPDAWFKQLKGKHRIAFDVTRPNDILPFAWPKVFLMTNTATGTPEKENNAVVILRHDAIPYAFNDNAWAKYKFGENFKINEPGTQMASVRNPFWKPKPGDFKIPGVGNVAIGINELQDSGVMFCVCNVAITVHSNVMAQQMNMKPEDVQKEWMASLLPGVAVMPSGVWAVGRAQEHGCAYCFAG